MLLPTLMASALVVALALRTIAWYRWRRIDWLLIRPGRIPSQGLRAAG
jgi:hypothetical protein